MAKFCGKCGAKWNDEAKVCGQCGMLLEMNRAAAPAVAGFGYVDPEEQTRRRKKVRTFVGFAVVVVVVIVVAKIALGFVGYKGTVRKIMNAYEDYDLDAIASISSEVYYFMGDDSYADDYFGSVISNDLDLFEEEVGYDYKLTYEITDSYDMNKRNYDELIDGLSFYSDFDADIIEKVKVVEVEVTAKDGGDDVTMELKLTLTKENGSWKLLYIS